RVNIILAQLQWPKPMSSVTHLTTATHRRREKYQRGASRTRWWMSGDGWPTGPAPYLLFSTIRRLWGRGAAPSFRNGSLCRERGSNILRAITDSGLTGFWPGVNRASGAANL